MYFFLIKFHKITVAIVIIFHIQLNLYVNATESEEDLSELESVCAYASTGYFIPYSNISTSKYWNYSDDELSDLCNCDEIYRLSDDENVNSFLNWILEEREIAIIENRTCCAKNKTVTTDGPIVTTEIITTITSSSSIETTEEITPTTTTTPETSTLATSTTQETTTEENCDDESSTNVTTEEITIPATTTPATTTRAKTTTPEITTNDNCEENNDVESITDEPPQPSTIDTDYEWLYSIFYMNRTQTIDYNPIYQYNTWDSNDKCNDDDNIYVIPYRGACKCRNLN